MIRKFIVILSIASLVGSTIFMVKSAHGADIITDGQIQAIKSQCQELQSTLSRLQQSDILLRTDRGELYRTIANKLMVPLNQRIATNQLDGSQLVAITADYNKTYTKFYDSYSTYAQALTDTTNINCSNQPTQFYDAITKAYDKRAELHAVNQKLVTLATNYRKEFVSFQTKIIKDAK